MRYRTVVLVLGLLTATLALGADDKVSRVFDPPKLPEDSRLGPPVNLDAPFSFKPDFKNKADWEKRAQELRTQVKVAVDLWPAPEKTPLNPVIHGKIDRDEYTVEKVFFASLPGHYVCGNLYRPKGKTGKLPAVLCPHGHWANGRFYEQNEANAKKDMESGAEKTMESARYPLQARCAMLARLGCVVFHYDMVGNADSKDIGHTQGFADAEAELRLQSFMGLQTWNSIRALDFITSLPDVDAQRVAVTGASGGGTQTFILCAVDERPAVSFPAVMVSTAMQGGCICENASLLRVGTNNIELAALFAPKAQGMTGANDWTKDIETKGLPELKQIYRLYGAEDKVMAHYASFPHNYNQVSRELMYNWVNKHLKLGHDGVITEKPFVPVPPKELSVFDAEHPRPKDATNADGVRKYLTQSSEKQMAELAKTPAEYRQVVSAALQAQIVDRMPAQASEVPGTWHELQGEGYQLRKGLITRPDEKVQIPTLTLTPKGWRGGVVLWVHPQGKASLFEGGQPNAQVKELLGKGLAVVSADVFLTGEYNLPDKATPEPRLNQKYHTGVPFAGYHFGYNRSLIAQRVRDILTLTTYAQGLHKSGVVHLMAFDKAGPCALLARALGGEAITRSAIDLNGFDFDQVKKADAEMMLPGALKYGGVYGYTPLITTGATALFNAPKGGKIELAKGTNGIHLHHDSAKPTEMVEWITKVVRG